MFERDDVSRRIKVGRKRPENNFDKINVGFWAYSSKFRNISDSTSKEPGNFGIYFGGQKYFYFSENGSRYLGMFLRYGLTRARFNRINSAFSGGISLFELFGNDQLGFAFTSAYNSDFFLEENSQYLKTETVFELCYTYYLTDFFTLQPDIQYVINPGMRKDIRNALSVALLAQISFEY